MPMKIFNETYRGFHLQIWTFGNGPYSWCYRIDEADYTESHDAPYASSQEAVDEGRKVAREWLDRWITGGASSPLPMSTSPG
jgi:hypothetical protein